MGSLLALSVGCADRVLDAPVVLTRGLGVARSLAPTGANSLYVAASSGLYEVDLEGAVQIHWEGDARGVSAHEDRLYLLSADTLRIGHPEADGGWRFEPRPAPAAVDVLAWCDESVLIARSGRVDLWRPGEVHASPWADDLENLRALVLSPRDVCGEVLALTDHQLLRLSTGGREEVLGRLVEARSVASDHLGRIWLAHGTPPRLSVLVDGKLQTLPHYLGDPRDLHFGAGEFYTPGRGYLADGGGTLDYLRVVPP